MKIKRKAANILEKFESKAISTVIRAEIILNDNSGQLAADHAGWVAVAFVLIGVVIYFTYPLLKDTVLPGLKDKFMNILNFNG